MLVAGAAAVILVLRLLIGRAMPAERVAESEKILPFLVGTIGGYYGLLTGFVVSITWGGVQSVRNAALAEINALADLDRIALTLPAPAGPALRHNVGDYLRSVIDHDLDAMKEGVVSRETGAAYGRLWSTTVMPRPEAEPWEATLLGRAFDKVGVVGEQRRIRLLISTESLPTVVWIILLFGGVIILAGGTIVSLRYGPPVREAMIAVAAMLCVVLFTIYAMDRPFRYGFGPEKSGYEALWQASHSAGMQTGR
jgi:hypothetical protein